MAVLAEGDRQSVWARFMREFLGSACALTKAEIRAAVDSTDDWIDGNTIQYNNSLPVAAKNNLTATQKTLLFVAVALRRAGL